MDFVPKLKEFPSGTAPGPGGCTNEFLWVCLDDEESLQLCVGHAIRLAIDLDHPTVLSIDGVGVYDHVLRSAMLGKIFEFNPRAALVDGEHIFAFLERACAHCQRLSGHLRSARCWKKCCLPQQAFCYTLARPEHGTEQVRSQRVWKSWKISVVRPEPHLTFDLIFVQTSIFSCFEHFSKSVRMEPHVTFRVVFVPPNPKLTSTTNP